MNQNDPRYPFIKKAAHRFVNQHFECIPSVLFEKACELAHNKGEYADDVLELIDTKYRVCPECDANDVDKGKELDDGEHEWKCSQCEAGFDDNDEPWERLPLAMPDHWPGAHGTVFWTTWNTVGEYAAQCGFEVYEPKLFNGIVLAIDGGGYDFYLDHWVPLYLAMGIEWHNGDKGYDEAFAKAREMGLV